MAEAGKTVEDLAKLVKDSRTTVVQADVLIGQDGFARAIRLVQ